MPWVRNKLTGLTHQVWPDHWALTKPDEYELLPEPEPEPEQLEPEPQANPRGKRS